MVNGELPPHDRLKKLADEAVETARKARKQRKPLGGANHYAGKLARIRAEATIAVRALSGGGRDVAPLAELVEACFSAETGAKERLEANRKLAFELHTSWAHPAPAAEPGEEDAVFPLDLLRPTRRKYLVSIAWQANGCFVKQWYDACAVMMRRLLETAIVEAFEAKGLAEKVKSGGDFLQLTALIDAAVAEPSWNLTRNTKTALPKLRDVGHTSAHSRHYTAVKSDIEKVQRDFRVAVQEFLSLAGLVI